MTSRTHAASQLMGSWLDDEPPAENERIAVVIPAYRAASHIATVLRGIPDFVEDVVVVDDASPDQTASVVRSLEDPRVHFIVRDENGGVGAAVLTGYRYAVSLGATVIVKMDADDQMDPSCMANLVDPILHREADYTKGNRFVHLGVLKRMPLVRRLGNLALSFLAKACSGYWDIFDPTNGYTAMRSELLDVLDWSAVDTRWFFETSMLIELNRARAVVADVYMPARYAGEVSSLSPGRTLREFPLRLAASFLRRLWLQYFVMDFSPVALFIVAGAGLTGFGFFWGLYHWISAVRALVPASTGTVMVAVLPLIIGVQLLLQATVMDIQNVPKQPLTSTHRRKLTVKATQGKGVPRR